MEEATLTSKSQITVPKAVREALGLAARTPSPSTAAPRASKAWSCWIER